MIVTEQTPTNTLEGRLSIEDQRMLAKQLKGDVDAFTDGILGVSPDAEDISGEVEIPVKDGFYHIARTSGAKDSTTEISFVSDERPEANISLLMSQSSSDPEAGFTITDPEPDGREQGIADQEGVLIFNPNLTPHPLPGRDEEAFRAVTDFLSAAQAETHKPVGELVQ